MLRIRLVPAFRTAPFPVRTFTAGPKLLASGPVDAAKDTIKKADRAVSDKLVDGIESAQQAKDKVAGSVKGSAKETMGDAKGKASELGGEAKGKAAELKGEAKAAKEDAKAKM